MPTRTAWSIQSLWSARRPADRAWAVTFMCLLRSRGTYPVLRNVILCPPSGVDLWTRRVETSRDRLAARPRPPRPVRRRDLCVCVGGDPRRRARDRPGRRLVVVRADVPRARSPLRAGGRGRARARLRLAVLRRGRRRRGLAPDGSGRGGGLPAQR